MVSDIPAGDGKIGNLFCSVLSINSDFFLSAEPWCPAGLTWRWGANPWDHQSPPQTAFPADTRLHTGQNMDLILLSMQRRPKMQFSMARKFTLRKLCRYALQIKGRWESNIKVWFPFMYSQKWHCYFQNRILMFCLLDPTLTYLWEISIFPGSICLFCCRKYVDRSWEYICKLLTDTCMCKLAPRAPNSQ